MYNDFGVKGTIQKSEFTEINLPKLRLCSLFAQIRPSSFDRAIVACVRRSYFLACARQALRREQLKHFGVNNSILITMYLFKNLIFYWKDLI